MNQSILKFLSLISFISLLCVSTTFASIDFATDAEFHPDISGLEEILDQAEKKASPEGRAVLVTARSMIASETIVVGSCWDYIHAIFNTAGFDTRSRPILYRSQYAGPYAEVSGIEGGDWLYFVNHSFGDVEHSAIFVDWTNFEAKEALMISYSGGGKAVPARYKKYDLSSVYTVIRPKPYQPRSIPEIKPYIASPVIEARE